MKQLVLDIRPDAPPTLENFVAGANAELVATVSLLASPATAAQLPARHIYLWGAPGSGRSHLLRAAVDAAHATGRPAHLLAAATIEDDLPDLMILDIMLPRLNGLEVLRQLRGERRTEPIILLSARGAETDKVT
ncbi:MAG TPA: response regulator, partial [Thauera aminoaromatica]|nr:response regulator [Thauera aminoaromatica]